MVAYFSRGGGLFYVIFYDIRGLRAWFTVVFLGLGRFLIKKI